MTEPNLISSKGRKLPYRKPEAVKELEHLANDEARGKHPTCPHLAPRTFRDDSANGLTQCIVKYISLKGGFASRINTGGVYDRKLQRFRRTTQKKGLADITGIYKGLSLQIEVKHGKDRQSEAQKKVEQEVIRSGGRYYMARNFADFKQWFDKL